MKKAIKAFYLLIVGLIVFLGGLLIYQGATAPDAPEAALDHRTQEGTMPSLLPENLIDMLEGSAM